MLSFNFKTSQKTYTIGKTPIGGQPGEHPTFLVGSIFWLGQKIVEDPNKGVFDQKAAENKCVVSLSTASDYLNNVKWTKTPIGAADADNLLEMGEQFEINIDTSDLGDGKALTNPLIAHDTFNIQVKPSLGSTITVQRTLPAQIDPVLDMH